MSHPSYHLYSEPVVDPASLHDPFEDLSESVSNAHHHYSDDLFSSDIYEGYHPAFHHHSHARSNASPLTSPYHNSSKQYSNNASGLMETEDGYFSAHKRTSFSSPVQHAALEQSLTTLHDNGAGLTGNGGKKTVSFVIKAGKVTTHSTPAAPVTSMNENICHSRRVLQYPDEMPNATETIRHVTPSITVKTKSQGSEIGRTLHPNVNRIPVVQNTFSVSLPATKENDPSLVNHHSTQSPFKFGPGPVKPPQPAAGSTHDARVSNQPALTLSQPSTVETTVIGTRLQVSPEQRSAKPAVESVSQTKRKMSDALYGTRKKPISEYEKFLMQLLSPDHENLDLFTDDDEDDEIYQLPESTKKGDKSDEDADPDDLDYDDEYEEGSEPGDRESAFKISEKELMALLEDYQDTQQKNATQLAKVNRFQSSASPPAIAPALHASNAAALSTGPFAPFTVDQLSVLSDQMKNHFQLLVQLFAMSHEIPNAEPIAKTALDFLFDLKSRADRAYQFLGSTLLVSNQHTLTDEYCTLPSLPMLRSLHLATSHPLFGPLNDCFTFYQVDGLDKLEIFRAVYERLKFKVFINGSGGNVPVRSGTSSMHGGTVRSIESAAGSASLTPSGSLSSGHGPSGPNTSPTIPFRFRGMSLPSTSAFSNGNSLSLPSSLLALLEIFRPQLNDAYRLNISSECLQNRVKFVDSEDRLLLKGLYKFGSNGSSSWESIQVWHLPAKNSRQIAIRYKNLISRTSPPNPIKDFYFSQFLPLSAAEENLLLQGVCKFRNNFHQISREFLPNRPAPLLKRFWLDRQSSSSSGACQSAVSAK